MTLNAEKLAQGLTLARPEVVPFRLTQNMIDAFGVSGQEGVFRRTAEITLQVLLPVSIQLPVRLSLSCTLHLACRRTCVCASALCVAAGAALGALESWYMCACTDPAPTRQPPQVLRRQ